MPTSPHLDLDLAYARYYLEHHGWTLRRTDDLKQIWTSEVGTNVILPLTHLADFEALLDDLVRRVAADENRAEDDVLTDLSWPAYDKLVARARADERSPAIPLQEALALNNALRDLIVAAARAADRPQASFRGGWSSAVGSYYDQVRMIPSQPGSFVLRALLPLNAEPPNELLFETTDTTSIRKVTRTLMSGVAAAQSAAEEHAAGASPSVFEDAVAQGVSADLLDALVRLGGPEGDPSALEVGVSWTYAAPEPAATPVRIQAGLIPVIAQGAAILRGAPEEVVAAVTGLVVRLHRETPLGPGEITVQGFVESEVGSSTRNVKIELDEPAYEDAIAAHRDGRTVLVRCIVRYGVRLEVVRVEQFSAGTD
jgi:hypothetical protein